jgi:uncharacterized delta-60 repeat protein
VPVRFLLEAIIVAASIAASATAASADPGDLDRTFGDGGRVRTNVSRTNDAAQDVAIQANGKIVVVGRASTSNLYGDVAVARYRPNGSLDPAFGHRGIVTRSLSNRSDAVGAVAIQANGRIVAAGGLATSGRTGRFAVLRFLRDGSLDDTFSGNGVAKLGFGDDSDEAADVAIQSDGRIVVVGTTGLGEFALARYEEDGTLDPTFGGDGKVTADPTAGYDTATGLAIQEDGAIVVSGIGGDGTMVAMRFATEGTPDAAFDGDGIVTVDAAAGNDSASAVAIQGDGAIVLAGEAGGCCEYTGSFAVVRLATDGSLDPGFGGGDGIAITNFGPDDDGAADLAIQDNGKIVAAGSEGFNGATARFALVRYERDGTRDASFGDRGKVVTRFSRGFDFAHAMALQADGRIVSVGSTTPDVDGLDSLFALARHRA